MSLRDQAVSGVRWTAFSTGGAAIIQFVQLVIIARLLSSRDFGLMGMVTLVVGLGQAFADMGLSAAVIQRQEISRNQLASLYWLNVGAGLTISVAVAILAPLGAVMFSEPELTAYVVTASSVFLISAIGTQFQALFEKELQFRLLAIQELAGTTVGAIVSVILALQNLGVWALVWGYVSAATVKCAVVAVPGWRQWKPGWRMRAADLKGFIGFGMYQMGERCINYFNFRSDQFVIGMVLGAQALGIYNFAFSLVVQPQSRINPILTRVAFPVFVRFQDDESRLRRGYLRMLRLLTGINAPLLLGLAVVAPSFIPLTFGQKWGNAIPLVQTLALFALIRSTGNPVGILLLARGRADLGFRWNLFLFFLFPTAIYLAARLGGLGTIAFSMVGLQLMLFLVAYRYLIAPIIGHGVAEYLRTLFVPVIVAGSMAAVVGSFALFDGWIPGASRLLTEIAIGCASYIGITWLFDRENLRQMLLLVRKQPRE